MGLNNTIVFRRLTQNLKIIIKLYLIQVVLLEAETWHQNVKLQTDVLYKIAKEDNNL